MGTGSAFQFKNITSKCRNQEGQQRNFAKHVQGPPSPTSSPTQATAFGNIAQHWLDKHKKNKKIIDNMWKLSRNVENLFRNGPKTLQILPKATKQAQNPTNVSKATPKAAKVYQKSPKDDPKAPKKRQTNAKETAKKHSKRHPETNPKLNPEPEILISPKCL